MSNDLLGKIAEIDKDVADNLKEGGLTNEDVKELCYDALKEIIPGDGMKLILLRSRIWKVISQETEKAPTDKSHPTTKALVEKRKIDMAVCVDNHIDLSEDDTFSSSSTDDKGLTKAGPSTKRAKPTPATPPATFQVKSPVFTIYRDRRVDLAVESGSIPEHLVHDIVRGTVSNMISMTLCDPWNRLPTTMELKEMAKSLVVTYPLLSDPVNGHERLFNRLKKRMYNKKTVENKRGPNKKKASNKITSYIKTTECPEDQQSNDVDPIMTDISTGEQQSNAEAGSSNSK
ncbi:uncharacterized protein LOC114542723 [Dendronephthya gigantea]|uniref:uncharacterized protein LOC114542723 n=1 Tax=Dendronephthya gigantea TaxID=151771 RepID=UPI00106B522B|nr:uncharacterized protein LOC114542723 [Dendronephthya gigantea]